MNNQRTKRLPRIILEQLSVGLIMTTIAFGVLFYAQGYRFNVKNFKLIKTGVIFLVSDPKDAQVYISGIKALKNTPYTENLTAGNYSAEVKKDGFMPWKVNFKIQSEMVTEFDSIVLFLSNIPSQPLTDEKKMSLLDTPIDLLAVTKQDNLLINNDYEIWANDKLVTRFSSPILKTVWYSDNKHILYQQGQEIRIIEIDGLNDTLLVKLKDGQTTKFVTNQKGDELYFIDAGEYRVAKIK